MRRKEGVREHEEGNRESNGINGTWRPKWELFHHQKRITEQKEEEGNGDMNKNKEYLYMY